MDHLLKFFFSIGQSLFRFQDVLVIHLESEWSSFWLLKKRLSFRERTIISQDARQQEVIASGDRAHLFNGNVSPAIQSHFPFMYGRIGSEELLYAYLFQMIRKMSRAAGVSAWLFFPRIVVLCPAEFPASQAEVWKRVLLRLGLPLNTFLTFPVAWIEAMNKQPPETESFSLLIDLHSTYVELSLMQGKTLLRVQRLWYGTQQIFSYLADYCREEYELDISLSVIEGAFFEKIESRKKDAYVWRGQHVSSQHLQSVTMTKKELIKAVRPFIQQVSQDAQTWLANEITSHQDTNLEKMELWLRASAFLPEEIADEMQKYFQQKIHYPLHQEFTAQFWERYFSENST